MKNLRVLKRMKQSTFGPLACLSLMFNPGAARENELARLSPDRPASHWMFARAAETAHAAVNPLTRYFSVLPRITVNDAGNVFVYIFNPYHTPIGLGFRDKDGNTLHRDKTTSLYYGKLLNVSELESGEYELLLNADSVFVRYVVTIGRIFKKVSVN